MYTHQQYMTYYWISRYDSLEHIYFECYWCKKRESLVCAVGGFIPKRKVSAARVKFFEDHRTCRGKSLKPEKALDH